MAEENSLPKTSINKLIKDNLSNSTRISSDFREVIAICGVEFIHLIATQAKDVAAKSNKKTLNTDHVLLGLNELGLGSYNEELKLIIEEQKQIQTKRPHEPEMTHEERVKKQKEYEANASKKLKEQYGEEAYKTLMSSLDKSCGLDTYDEDAIY